MYILRQSSEYEKVLVMLHVHITILHVNILILHVDKFYKKKKKELAGRGMSTYITVRLGHLYNFQIDSGPMTLSG